MLNVHGIALSIYYKNLSYIHVRFIIVSVSKWVFFPSYKYVVRSSKRQRALTWGAEIDLKGVGNGLLSIAV